MLNSCRDGDLQEDDFNFLHGYPTEGAIKFWYEHREDSNWTHDEKMCSYTKYRILDHWQNGQELQVLSVKLACEKGKGVQESYVCSRMDLMHEPD